jgi:mono/diheme cytochrome c family protein
MKNWILKIPILVVATCTAAVSQNKAPANRPTASDASSLSGVEMYRIYCASCHGLDGKGKGPAADALKKTPPDLTQISNRNAGEFPNARISRQIIGYEVEAVHGSQAMPIWGAYFRPDELLNLIEYIRSIQQKRAEPQP